MLRMMIFYLFFAPTLLAGSQHFIDNPSFEHFARGWEKTSRSGTIYEMTYPHYDDEFQADEDYLHVTTKLFALGNPKGGWGKLEYRIDRIMRGTPLFYYVKAGYAGGAKTVDVEVSIIETGFLDKEVSHVFKSSKSKNIPWYIKIMSNKFDEDVVSVVHYKEPYEQVLTVQRYAMEGNTKCHDILATFPTYKVHDETDLILRIRYKNDHDTGDFYLFHGQVGNDRITIRQAHPRRIGIIK